MRHFKTIVLFVLLLLARPPFLQGQLTTTFTFTTNRLVPDGNASGLSDVRTLDAPIARIASVTLHLKTAGEFNGDLYGYLSHSNGFAVLLNRPGKTASNPHGYADSGFDVTFQDGAPSGDIHRYQTNTAPAPGSPLTGTWQPDGRNVDPAGVLDTSNRTTSLANFNGLNAAGQWTLFLADLESGGTNQLTQWSLTIAGAAYPTLAWANPADIVYGTALGGSQLSATATYGSTNVPGTFAYTNAAGVVLHAGTLLPVGPGQALFVTFTPTDSTTFLPCSTNVTLNVNPATVTVASGLTANNKVYDGTTNATITSNNVSLQGVLAGDAANVALSTNGYLAAFAGKGVANGIAVTVSGLTLTGSAAHNYTLTQPSPAANITPKPLNFTGLSAANKEYDAKTAATLSGTAATLAAEAAGSGSNNDGAPYTGDTVSFTTGTLTGAFAGKDVANGIMVTVTGGVTLTAGGQSADYSVGQPNIALTANITPKPLNYTGIGAVNKVYNANTTATFSGTAATLPAEEVDAISDGKPYVGDTVSFTTGTLTGAFASKDVANGITVTLTGGVTLTPGGQSADYSVGSPSTALTANITPKALTMSGLTVPPSRVFDGTASAAVSGTAALQSAELAGTGSTSDGKPYLGDTVSITGTATGTYNSTNVASANTVSFGGLSLGGAQAGDYSLTMQAAAAASITPAATTGVLGSSANPALPGANVTFTNTISPVAPGAGVPGGMVNFRIDGSIGGSVALSGGAATFATNALAHGSHTVVAEYAGDPNFLGVTNSLALAQVINTPPVAGSLTIQRYPTMGVQVSLATVISNCSDADNDPLAIPAVSSTSTNGGSITVAQGWIYYAPAQGYTGQDAFTYTVADPYGGSATGTITVTIEVDNSPSQNVMITALPNGSFLINGNGIPGYTYHLQSTPTLTSPNWQNIGTVTADSTGAFQDTVSPGGGTGFYRTVYP